MFGRQAFSNAFQPFGFTGPFQVPAVNPFQQFTAGTSPFGIGTNFSGISPLTPQFSGFGTNPFIGGQTFGINPFTSGITPFFGAGITPTINPMFTAQLAATNPVLAQLVATNPVLAQLAATNPMLLSFLTQQTAGGSGTLANQPLGSFTPFIPQFFGTGAGQFGGQAFGSPFGFVNASQSSTPYHILSGQIGQPTAGNVNPNLLGQLCANPALAADPVVSSVLAQQLNPLAQLPIRPLINAQQPDFSQANIPGTIGAITGQVTDFTSPLVQAQLASQLAANPLQQAYRAYTGSPWIAGTGVPSLTGQVSPFAQTGIPFCF